MRGPLAVIYPAQGPREGDHEWCIRIMQQFLGFNSSFKINSMLIGG
jgi:hypothetical protein